MSDAITGAVLSLTLAWSLWILSGTGYLICLLSVYEESWVDSYQNYENVNQKMVNEVTSNPHTSKKLTC